MKQICEQFKIKHHNSASYCPKMNGTVEAANKNVKKIMTKITNTYKDWHKNYLLLYMPIELQSQHLQEPPRSH